MQITRSRGGFVAVVVLALAALATALLVSTGPATAAGAGRIGPGTQMVTAGRTCTAGFVFRDAQHRVFVGYAASCATHRSTTSNPCRLRPLAAGTRVRFVNRGVTVGYGELRYSSLRVLRRAGVTDAATCAANDFALVQVRGAARRQVDANVPYWGGPTGVGSLPDAGATVFGLVRESATARALPRAGTVDSVDRGTAEVTTLLPGGRGARGSGFLDASGRAVGILTRSTTSGANTVTSLAAVVGFARAHGVPGLRVVHGSEPFSGSAVL
ncbi:MAG TPA: hypothetical protein VFE07_07315 [Marmoricola sp.]|jgi:hypothetical protein|nr:hypothetical protein [Marmoricola sp.]